MSTTIGFAGLGNMGSAMATRLQDWLDSQHDFRKTLSVYNRSPEKAETLVKSGATLAKTPADLAEHCSIVFSMLGTDKAVDSVFKAFLAAKPQRGTIFAECSTVYPDLSVGLAKEAEEHGVHYLTCPVFGRPDRIAQGQGVFMCAGHAASREKVEPLLEVMGRAIIDCGDSVRAANALKLAGNYCISGFIELFAEAMTLGEANGVRRPVFQQMTELLFPGAITTGYCRNIACDKFKPTPEDPGFSLTGGMKDLSRMKRLARESGCKSPIADIAYQHMEEAVDLGGKDLDWCALALPLRKAAGQQLPDFS